MLSSGYTSSYTPSGYSANPRDELARTLTGAPPPSYAPAPAPTPYAAQPAAPAPSPGRATMAQPTYAPQSTAPPAQTQGSLLDRAKAGTLKSGGADRYSKMWDEIYKDIDPQDMGDLKDYVSYIQSMPTYKGSRDVAMAQIMNYARQLRMARRNQQGQTYPGLAKIGDENASLQRQMAATLAARGHSGTGGVVGGAYSNLAARTAGDVTDYIGERDDAARREKLAIMLAQMQRDAQFQQMMGERAYQEDQKGGFWDDLLGAAGNLIPIAGGLLGGPAGALAGGALAGGRGRAPQPSPFM